MKSFINSKIYAQTRVRIGVVAAVLGAVIVVRTFMAVGFDLKALPPYVMGLAMIALGGVRLRDYRAMQRRVAAADAGRKNSRTPR